MVSPYVSVWIQVVVFTIGGTGVLGQPDIYPMHCLQCNYYEADANDDPHLQSALVSIESYGAPTLRQCMYDYTTNSIHRIDTSGIPSVECSGANLTYYSTLLGTSLDGFKCAKIATTFTLTDMNNGQYGEQMQIQGVVRGCLPYKAMSPFGLDLCFDMADTYNPYVQLYLSTFNGLALFSNVILEPGVQGKICLCSHNTDCNSVIIMSPSNCLVLLTSLLCLLVYKL